MTAVSGSPNVIAEKASPICALFVVIVKNEADTVRIAECLAPLLQPGDAVLLNGGLATGKTYFTRHVVESLKTEDDISSPTYNIANMYQTLKCDVLHVDAYRLADAQEFHNLGLEMEIETSICLIEWGSRIVGAFDDYLQISISIVPGQEDGRRFEISASGIRSNLLMDNLQQCCDGLLG